MKQERVALTGNDSCALALRQAMPDVVAAYPITPQTEIMHKFAEYVADGETEAEFINAESEHSAMSACVGASVAGARAATATAGPGLALLWEVLYVAAALRCPIVMPVVSRALSGPINIHCDHSDSMGARDAGWIQLFSENSQQAYDNVLQAFKIGEHPDVRLPVMVMLDGFILSHTVEVLNVLSDADAAAFVGEYKPSTSLLDVKNPITVGSLVLPDFYFECRWQQVEAMRRSFKIIESVGSEFGRLSGRTYGLLAPYRLEDAEVALVGLGSTMGTARVAVDNLRTQGIKAGLLSIRCYRPFPASQIREALRRVNAIAVLDRSISYGLEGGPLFHEVRSSMYGATNYLTNYIYGLGGRDVNPDELAAAVRQTLDGAAGKTTQPLMNTIGLREAGGKPMCI